MIDLMICIVDCETDTSVTACWNVCWLAIQQRLELDRWKRRSLDIGCQLQ